jgi:integrase/recombinase XerD
MEVKPMIKKEVSLTDLIFQAEKCLRELQYSNKTMNTYRLIWQHFSDYAEKENQHQYTNELANGFLDQYYGINNTGKPKIRFYRIKIRAMRILDDIKNTGSFQRTYVSKSRIRSNEFEAVYKAFQLFMMDQNQSKKTIEARLFRIDVFFRYLESNHVLSTATITPKIIIDFMAYLQENYSSAGKSNVMFTLRYFLTCTALSTHFPESLGKVITVIRTNKNERLPSFYSQEEVKRILDSVDRSSRQGKKDYLIILLAAQLGIRVSDIRCLKLAHLNWDRNTIEFSQQKTKKYITLPINEHLKYAILDYLKNGRANTAISDTDHLFIRTRAPYEPYSENTHFSGLISLYFIKSGVQIKDKHHGLHSLRHSLASQLFKQLTPITSIANVLGHHSIEATKRYIQIDLEQLRTVALEVPGYE